MFSCLPPLALAHLIHWPDRNPYCWAPSALIFYSRKVTHLQIADKFCKKLLEDGLIIMSGMHLWVLCMCVCVASSFLFWCLGRKFFWWPWKPHWNTRFIIPVVFWITMETWERLNRCLSQAWLELKSDNSHVKNPLLGSGLERKSVLQNKDRKWPSSLGSRSNTDDYSMSGAAFPAHAGEWDNDTVFICTAAKVTG